MNKYLIYRTTLSCGKHTKQFSSQLKTVRSEHRRALRCSLLLMFMLLLSLSQRFASVFASMLDQIPSCPAGHLR